MKLQILVTHYNEPEEVVKPLLDSIALQQSVDFNEVGVVICNDGGDCILSRDFLNSYTFNIDYIIAQHSGVSATRNRLLDYSTAEYVMFCDCDDMFVSNCGLYQVFVDMNEGFDTLTSVFIEEVKRNGEPLYISHENDATFIHGKVHKRQYLIDNNIRWNDNLTIHEDSFFNVLCKTLTDKDKYCTNPFYLWKWRKESICRHDELYLLKTFDKFIDSNDALVDELIKRGRLYEATFYCVHMIFETYYTMNKQECAENEELTKRVERRFAEYFEKHKSLWESTSTSDRVTISAQAREKVMKRGMLVEAITIFDWLKKIGEEQCLQENKEES